jgi:hypothetical protein
MADEKARAPRTTRRRKLGVAVGVAVLTASAGLVASVWTVSAASSTLQINQSLSSGQYMLSPGGGYQLLLNSTGNLVLSSICPAGLPPAVAALCPQNRTLWSSNTYDASATVLWMQSDGNLVLYDVPTGHAIWATGTQGSNYHFSLQDDGNAVVYNSSGGCGCWATGTYHANNTQATGTNGTCWGYSGYGIVSSPKVCRTSWSARGPIYFRAVDNGFSAAQPGWVSDAQTAVTDWNNAPGPQHYCYYWGSGQGSCTSNDSWIYLNAAHGKDIPYLSGNAGVTYNCDVNYYCSPFLNSPMNAWFSNVYVNEDVNFPPNGGGWVENTVAHESGHAMMLSHNVVDPSSIMYPGASNTGPYGPDPNDWGSSANCANAAYGLACIYGSSSK